MRGLAVAMLEARDFAAETSSRSSKLIHGGLRYLPQFQFRLVRNALRERERLRRLTAPHLVRPVRFLFPLYRGRGFGRGRMVAGLFLYDLFARIPRSERHRSLSAEEVLELEPMLAGEGLAGGATYCDAWADDARITLENVLDAALHGAAVANYASVEGFSRMGGRLGAASVRDRLSGRGFEVRARLFVNAAGPWVDDVRRMEDRAVAPCIRLTKGVHLVFPRERLPVRESLVLSDDRDRIVFVMPHGRYVLVGTTDTDFAGDPAVVAADRGDVQYLLDVLGQSLRGAVPGAADVASSFAGLRALVTTSASRAPSSVPREEVLLDSDAGMITVAGGKLTTHREIAEKVVNHALKKLGRAGGKSPTAITPLPGARPLQAGDPSAAKALQGLDPITREILDSRYGSRAVRVAAIIAGHPALAAPLAEGCSAVAGEVLHAIRDEMACSLADFMVRRTSLVWRAPLEAVAAAPAAASLMARELGWDRAREEAEVRDFIHDMQRRRSP
jgi:glycerol-3-phosphate dehydrogenase